MKKKPWGRRQAESDDDDASVDFDGDDSGSDYDENEKLLLEKTRKELVQGPYDSDEESEEEVFPLRNKLDQYEDSEEEEEEDDDNDNENTIEQHSDDDDAKHISDSDIEGAESGTDDLPNDKAWGQLRRSFYNTDYLDKDHGGFEGEEDEETAKMEEEEARKIHQRMMSELENVDLDNELFIGTKETENVKGSDTKDITQMMTVKKDLSSMSDREKRKLLMKESPEMFGLIADFKSHMGSAQEKLCPFLKLVKSGDITKSRFTEYVQCYYEIILNYCTNIGFYFLMKSTRKPVQNHPIMNRLLRYREIVCEQNKLYESLIKPQIDEILSTINLEKTSSNKNKKTQKKLLNILKKPVQQVIQVVKPKENINDIKANESDSSVDEDITEVQEEPVIPTEEKRGITYQISKNKGLTPRRKKELRNPRVKNRMKFRKAKIRRKGQIREPRTEMRRYDGEYSGIKVNLSKSIKIKA